MYNVQCTMYNEQCTMYNVKWTFQFTDTGFTYSIPGNSLIVTLSHREKTEEKNPVYRMTHFSVKVMERKIKMYILCHFDAYT